MTDPVAGEVLCQQLEVGFAGQAPTDASKCRTGKKAHCIWSYPYRDSAAKKRQNALAQSLSSCAGFTASEPDTAVNHPDTYSAELFTIGQRRWSLSRKDKAALSQTFVILRRLAPD